MTHATKILRNLAIGAVVLVLLLAVVVYQVVRTDWFRQTVRDKIVDIAQQATGGKVELGSFSLSLSPLRAELTDLVIHGTEPAGVEPLLRAARIQVDLSLLSGKLWSIDALRIEQPRVNLITLPDGSLNLPKPEPDQQPSGDSAPLATLIDLAVGHFELNNGFVHFNSASQPLDVRANNLQARLDYSSASAAYQGRLSMQPLYVTHGRRTPVVFTVNVPVTLQRDRVELQNASITTPLSAVNFSAAVENLRDPEATAQIKGFLAIEDLNNLAQSSLRENGSRILFDAEASGSSDQIRVGNLAVSYGASRLEASGTARGAGSLQIHSVLDLPQLARLTGSDQRVEGQLILDGATRFDGNNLEVERMRLQAFGAELTAYATLEELERFQASGNLAALNLRELEQRLGVKPLPYDGSVSGSFQASGSLENAADTLQARTLLTITPGRRGVPVSGKIEAVYNAAQSAVTLRDSFLSLPHSRVEFAGTIESGLRFNLSSRDLSDFFAALPSPPPVKLNGGQLRVSALAVGTTSDPRITGNVSATRLSIQNRQFDSIQTAFSAASSRITVDNGVIRRGPMVATLEGSVGLADWSPKPTRPVALEAEVRNGDLADMLALAGRPADGYSGALTASVDVAGTVGNPTGSANLLVSNGTIAHEPFDQLQGRVQIQDRLIRIPSVSLIRGQERATLTAEFRHPAGSFGTGQLTAAVETTAIELGSIRNIESRRSGVAGQLKLDASLAAELEAGGELRPVAVNGNVAARNLRIDGQDYGDLSATASTSGQTVAYRLTSNFAGSSVQASGQTALTPDYPTTLNAQLQNLPVERVLAAAGNASVPARGQLSGEVNLRGTVRQPQGNLNLNLRNAVLYDEPIDSIRVRAAARPELLNLELLEVAAGPSRITLTGQLDHPSGDYRQGTVTFDLDSSRLDLARIRNVQARRPGLSGELILSAEGKATLPAEGPVALENLQARFAANDLQAAGRQLGALELSARGTAARMDFALNSTLAGAAIQGKGNAALRDGYPLSAELAIDDLSWSGLRPLLGETGPPPFEAVTSGRITASGPASDPTKLSASLNLSKLQIRPLETTVRTASRLSLSNQGPIAVSLKDGVVRVESARITGDQTSIALTGSGSVRGDKLDFRLDTRTNLELLQAFSSDIYSSGAVIATAAIKGTAQKPLINGRLELDKATVSPPGLPTGLSNARGVVEFNGTTATIQSFSGESGGGKVTLGGFVTRQDSLRFSLQVKAESVRFRVQRGVSAVADANISLAGSTEASLASGSVTIERFTYAPQSDIGSLLTRSGPPVQASATPSPLLQNMRIDVAVRTATGAAVQASLAQNLQFDADLRVRGRASQPGVTGSLQMRNGELAFFGSTYQLSSGSIFFYNPNRIEPVLDITLETKAKGVTVVLNVTGPVDNMKLSYTSDPPLQFQEIVALLASGKAPTSDPTLLANQPSQPPQTLQQRGESALVSKAIADPLSNRLERVFGVSQLKIDPTFTSGSQLPQARVTLQQQVASNLLFTYVTALDDPNTQIVRIEWSMTPQWSALANRDENGIVSINLLYKKQFR